MKTFTIQFDYDGQTYTYIIKSYNAKNDNFTYASIAYNIVETIIEKECGKKEGIIATNIKLFNKEGDILFNSSKIE